MRATQLPYQFKTLGVLLLVLAALIILLDHTGFILSYYQGSHQFGKTVGGAYLLPADYVRASFYIYQIVPVLTIASFMLIVFSKQKIEDEWIKQKRLIAYKIAFFCGAGINFVVA